MRAIKFEYMVNDIDRGWCKEIFPLFDIERGFLSRWFDDNKFRFNPVGGGVVRRQFTGLLDKNGVEIYEGDILQERDNEDNPYSVFWCEDSAQWQTHCNESENCSVFEMNEALVEFAPYDVIIGNIHESPELLEQ